MPAPCHGIGVTDAPAGPWGSAPDRVGVLASRETFCRALRAPSLLVHSPRSRPLLLSVQTACPECRQHRDNPHRHAEAGEQLERCPFSQGRKGAVVKPVSKMNPADQQASPHHDSGGHQQSPRGAGQPHENAPSAHSPRPGLMVRLFPFSCLVHVPPMVPSSPVFARGRRKSGSCRSVRRVRQRGRQGARRCTVRCGCPRGSWTATRAGWTRPWRPSR